MKSVARHWACRLAKGGFVVTNTLTGPTSPAEMSNSYSLSQLSGPMSVTIWSSNEAPSSSRCRALYVPE